MGEDYPAPALLGVQASEFTNIIDEHVMYFGFNEDDKPCVPPRVPLCRLVNMDMAQMLNSVGPAIALLKNSFLKHGYIPDTPHFYVMLADLKGSTLIYSEEIKSTWSDLWQEEDAKYVEECEEHENFMCLRDKMFSVFDGNHRLLLFMEVAAENPEDPKYHARVQRRIFKGNPESFVQIESATHALNGIQATHVESS